MSKQVTYYYLDDEEILRAHEESLRASERHLLRQEIALTENPDDLESQRVFEEAEKRVQRVKEKHTKQKAKVDAKKSK